jgi:hypothetical protein
MNFFLILITAPAFVLALIVALTAFGYLAGAALGAIIAHVGLAREGGRAGRGHRFRRGRYRHKAQRRIARNASPGSRTERALVGSLRRCRARGLLPQLKSRTNRAAVIAMSE